MKHIYLLLLFFTTLTYSQQAYYNGMDFSLTGNAMFTQLQDKISVFKTDFNYGDNRDTMKITDDEDFDDADGIDTSSTVWLLYGYQDGGNCIDDRTRNEDDFGGLSCDYNREHTFARSLADPSMGDANNSSTGIVADPHNIRASDVQMNGDRGSKRFASGTGNAGDSNGGWYPGNEWKGDVARMMMYMYARYGNQCKPDLVGIGSKEGSTEMLELFLQWNIEDPVSDFEDQRNDYLETIYLSRNPFIDNPALATVIWGGDNAEDRWGNLLSNSSFNSISYKMFPNPSTGGYIYISVAQDTEFTIYNIIGKHILTKSIQNGENKINISNLQNGIYLVKMNSENGSITKKLIKQ